MHVSVLTRPILLRVLFALACLAAMVAPPCLADAPAAPAPVPEYALKAALFFKLPPFVYRPDTDRSTPLTMCILGSNPFGNALDRLASATIDGRPVRIRRLDAGRDAGSCEFVFISRSEADDLDGTLRRLATHPVVTVSDIDGFARAGGMVEFALGSEGSIAILINRSAGQRLGIEFNAQLLRLARVVVP